MPGHTGLIIFNIFLIGVIAIIIVKLYYRKSEGPKTLSKQDPEETFSFTEAISSRKNLFSSKNDSLTENVSENNFFNNKQKPSKPRSSKQPQYFQRKKENIYREEQLPRQEQVIRQAPRHQEVKATQEENIYSFDKINFADRPTGVIKTEAPITKEHRDIMTNHVDKIVETEEARIEEDLKKKEETKEDSELKDLFTIDELIKESKRKDEERKNESENIKRKSEEIKNKSSTKNDEPTIAEELETENSAKEESTIADEIEKEVEAEKPEEENINDTLDNSDEVIGTPTLKTPTKVEKSINDIINDTVEEEAIEETSEDQNKPVDETNIDDIEVITPEEDTFGTPIEDSGLFDEEYEETPFNEAPEEEYNESLFNEKPTKEEYEDYNELDYRKDLDKIKNKVKSSKLFNDFKNKIQEYREEKEEGSTDDEEDFIRNISYYDNATRYENDFETYGNSYEPIEPIAPSEQEIREENTRNLINITREHSSPQQTTNVAKSESSSGPARTSIKININNNETVLKKNDEIIFKYNGDTYSSKVYSIIGNDITVKFRGKRVKIKPSDVKKVF